MTQRRIRIVRGGEHTHLDEFRAPLKVVNQRVTLRGSLYGEDGIVFEHVSGTFLGCAITMDAGGRPVRYELVEAPREGTIIQ